MKYLLVALNCQVITQLILAYQYVEKIKTGSFANALITDWTNQRTMHHSWSPQRPFRSVRLLIVTSIKCEIHSCKQQMWWSVKMMRFSYLAGNNIIWKFQHFLMVQVSWLTKGENLEPLEQYCKHSSFLNVWNYHRRQYKISAKIRVGLFYQLLEILK